MVLVWSGGWVVVMGERLGPRVLDFTIYLALLLPTLAGPTFSPPLVRLNHLAQAGRRSDCVGAGGRPCAQFHFPDGLQWVGDTLLLGVGTDPDECNSTGSSHIVSSTGGATWRQQRAWAPLLLDGIPQGPGNRSKLGLPFHLEFANAARTELTVRSTILREEANRSVTWSQGPRNLTVRGFPQPVRPAGGPSLPGGHSPVANFNPSGVLRTADGTLLTLLTNVLYGPESNASDWPSAVLAFESGDHGFTWDFRSTVSAANDEAAWVRLADGRILCVMRHDTSKIMQP